MSGREPEERVRWPAVHQRWRHATFLHWRYDPAVLRPLLPDAVEPDMYDGSGWVGLTPFLVTGYRLLGIPGLPGAVEFAETNVRTYVRDRAGRDAIWFLSLDASSPTTVLGGRLGYGAPYLAAEMSIEREGGEVRYRARRRSPAERRGHDITVRPGAALIADQRTPLDDWLTGRWRAWSTRSGGLVECRVEHEPWPLHRATVERLEEDLLDAAGLPPPQRPPEVHFSPGVDARLALPRRHPG